MPKVLEDSLGNLEYLLLGLTFLGVLYLVVKQEGIKFSASRDAKDGFAGNHGIRFHTVSDGTNNGQYDPVMRGIEGMGSMSAHEAPAWHQTAHDPSELDMVSFEQAAANVEYNALGAAARQFGPNNAVSAHVTKWDTAGQEGLRSGYSKTAARQGMQDKLAASMMGANAAL